jgi:hypothetical protein
MKTRKSLLLSILMLFGTVTFAQDYPKVEVPLNYSYMRFHPENSGTVSAFSLNGGGGGVAVYLSHWVGIEAEFEGYATAGTKRFTFAGGAPICPIGCTVNASGDLFTYNVGPIFKYRAEHFEPFFETLFGGAHSNVYGNIVKACQIGCQTVGSPSNNAFDFIIGGGIDVPVTHEIAIRAFQLDYVLTRFDTAFTNSNHNQSNFRVQAGVVFRF